jgi:hypothetical protein
MAHGEQSAAGRPAPKLVDHTGVPVDEATLANLFHGPSPALFDDPVCGAALRRLAIEDPDVIAAVADVDRSMIREALLGTPEERLRSAVRHWNGLASFRRVG